MKSTATPKKLSASALVNLKRWLPLSEFEGKLCGHDLGSDLVWGSVPGGAQLLQTIADKDIRKFREALNQFPELLWEDFTCRDAKGRHLRSGRLADVIIDIGWTQALDALWQAGDQFDGEMVQIERNPKYGPFETAMFNGQSSAYNRMIKLGVSINGKGDNPPLLIMAHRRHFDRKKLTVLGESLANTNVDLFKQLAPPNNQTLFGALLKRTRYELILPILQSIKTLPEDFDASIITREWESSITNTSHKEGMVNVLLELKRLDCPPPSMDQLVKYGASFSGPCLGSDAFDGMMDAALSEHYYVIEDAASVFNTLSKYNYAPILPWINHLQADQLMLEVPKAPSPARPGRRI